MRLWRLPGRLRRKLLLGLRLLEFTVVVERMAEIRRKIVRLRRPRFGGLLRLVRRFVQLGARFGQDFVDGPAVAAMFLSHGMPLPVPDDLRSDACSRFRAAQRLDERQPEGKGTSGGAAVMKFPSRTTPAFCMTAPHISGSMPG